MLSEYTEQALIDELHLRGYASIPISTLENLTRAVSSLNEIERMIETEGGKCVCNDNKWTISDVVDRNIGRELRKYVG